MTHQFTIGVCAVLLLIFVLVMAMVLISGWKHRVTPLRTGGVEYPPLLRDARPPTTHLLLPAGEGPHVHLVTLDSAGAGVSTMNHDHRHRVENSIDVGLAMGDGDVRHQQRHQHDISAFIVDTEDRNL